MKAVVSSLVALAIAIAPAFAMATPEKPAHPKHHVIAKAKPAKKIEKVEKADKAPVVQVRHMEKPGKKHHGEMVAHKGEPKPGEATVIPASLTTKPKLTKATAREEMPKLPAPAANKAMKEKGATKKHAEKKDKSADKNDGQPERDEEFADLVARIRGHKGKSPLPAHEVKKPCFKDSVEVMRGPEIEKLELMTCDGAIVPSALDRLSILVRPGSAARPTASIDELEKSVGKDKKKDEIAPGIRRVDSRLVERVQAIVEHFKKKGIEPKISVVSGYRPQSIGSMHASGRAMDFRFEGAKNEDVVAFCKTLEDTGCGYYPNSSFVHVDVRDPGAGHVSWIDASGPGETPRYVTSWPPPVTTNGVKHEGTGLEPTSARIEEPAVPVDEHPALPPPSAPLEK